MKYLRKFFESSENSYIKEELEKFCNENLAYLIDDGFKIIVDSFNDCYKIELSQDRLKPFYFKNIKNEFIPFFEFLKSKYIIIRPLSHESEDILDIIMFVAHPSSYNKWKIERIFYNESKILSGKCTNRRLTSIEIFIKK